MHMSLIPSLARNSEDQQQSCAYPFLRPENTWQRNEGLADRGATNQPGAKLDGTFKH